MKIHYFQRYHSKENVSTANTMLLLSRLYSFSSDKFFRLLKSEIFSESFEPELVFTLQEKSLKSTPDATITQESFKIVVETKLSDWFYEDQLERHLKAFGQERFKVLLTLAPQKMAEEKKASFDEKLKKYNKEQETSIIHINTTFEALAKAIDEVLDDRDYEMKDVLEDYLNYCYSDKLIPIEDEWKYMRVQLAGTTFDFNKSNNVYYDSISRPFRAHKILGLYKNKSVRAIGKVIARITAVETEKGKIKFTPEYGDVTEDRKNTIKLAMEDAIKYGYDIRRYEHRYFFVDNFYETDFQKISPRAPMGSRIFDLTEVLGISELPADTKVIAEQLKFKQWT